MTRQELRLLDYIKTYIGEHRVPPTTDEMRDQLGLASKSGVSRMVSSLERQGLVTRRYHAARSVEPVGFNLGQLSRCSVRELEDIIIHAKALHAVKSRKAAA